MEPSSSEVKINVLVVDDNDSIRETLTILLSRRGYRCESAVNGQEAMEKVAQAHFDVVITDVHMPRWMGSLLRKSSPVTFQTFRS